MTQSSDEPAAPEFVEPATPVRLREHGIAWRTVFDEVIALDTESSQYHAVNSTGRDLWELLDRGTTVGELVTALTAAHPEAQSRAGDDITRFLTDLHDRGLVETVSPAP